MEQKVGGWCRARADVSTEEPPFVGQNPNTWKFWDVGGSIDRRLQEWEIHWYDFENTMTK